MAQTYGLGVKMTESRISPLSIDWYEFVLLAPCYENFPDLGDAISRARTIQIKKL